MVLSHQESKQKLSLATTRIGILEPISNNVMSSHELDSGLYFVISSKDTFHSNLSFAKNFRSHDTR